MERDKKTVFTVSRHYREAPVKAETFSEENRTVDVVWATTTPVLRYLWLENGEPQPYYEVLSMNPAHIVLERFAKGLSVLDSHNRESTDCVLGIAKDPVFPKDEHGEHTESWCKARFSSNNLRAEPVFKDIKDKILIHWSFGYDVLEMEETDRAINGIPVYLATLWEPFELSVVPVPADPNAGTRDKPSNLRSYEISFIRGNVMNKKQGQRSEGDESEDEDKKKGKKDEGNTDPEKDEEDKGKKGKKSDSDDEKDEERGKPPRMEPRTDARSVADEKRRQREIRAAVAAFPGIVKPERVEEYIENDFSADDVRRELIDAKLKIQPPVQTASSVDVGVEGRNKKIEAMARSILVRAAPGVHKLEPGDDARQFRGFNLVEIAKECLGDAGMACRGMTPREVFSHTFGLALSGRRDLATGDFPIVLSDAVNKSLRKAYDSAPQTFQPFCSRSSAKDFKDMHLMQVGDIDGLKEIGEGEEYKRGAFREAKESYRIKKYGEIIPITLEALINDDLRAFARIPTMIANEARELESDLIYDILLGNPKMGDGKPLFHADHGNLGSASAINFAGMNAAFIAMGEQKFNPKSKRSLNLRPSFLLVGNHKQAEAGQYLTAITPAKTEDTIPGYLKQLSPICEGRVNGKKWFLMCAPGRIDTIEYAYLEGEEGLYTEERYGFEVDGMEIKARLFFGAKAVDWRGMYMNPGA